MKSVHDLLIALLIATPLVASVTMLVFAAHDGIPAAPGAQAATVTTHGY